MKILSIVFDKKNYIRRNAIFFALAWTIGCVCIFFLLRSNADHIVYASSEAEAKASIQKDLLYRLWATEKGGVYAPINKKTPPNPYLNQISEQNITTPSGVKLTLVNPAFMMRQVHELGAEFNSAKSHITSLRPIRPENAPDDWERSAMERFSSPNDEFKSIDSMQGTEYFRYIKPFDAQSGCLKCHINTKPGDLLGSISVSIPIQKFTFIYAQFQKYYLLLFLVWLVGNGVISIAFFRINKNENEKARLNDEISAREDFLNTIINNVPAAFLLADELTQSIVRTNDDLEKLTGRASDELIGMDFFDLFVDGDGVVTSFEMNRLKSGECKQVTGQTRIKTPNEALVWANANIKLIKGHRGERLVVILLEDFTERMRFDEAIIASEEKFVRLVNSLPVGVFLASPEGQCKFVNPYWQGIFDMTFEEAFGDGWVSKVHPDDRDRMDKAWGLSKENRTPLRVEFRIVLSDGQEKWIDGFSTPITDREGIHTGFVGIALDITERKNVQDKLEESESKIKRLVETLPNGVYSVGLDGKIYDPNPALARITGYSAEELCKMYVWDLMVEGEIKDSLPRIFDELRTNAALPKIFLCDDITKSGQLIKVRVDWDYLFDANGEHVGYVSVMSDITEQERAISNLKDSEEKYRKLIEQSPDAICMHKDQKFIFANRKVYQLLGIDESDSIIGRSIMDFVHPDYLEIVKNRQTIMTTINGAVPTIEEKFIRADGTSIDVEVSSCSLTLNNEKIVQVIFRDISERKRIEQERATISRISWVFMNLISIEEIFAAAQNVLSEAFGFSIVNIGLYDSDTNRIIMVRQDGSIDTKGYNCISENTTTEYVKTTGKPLVVSDISLRKDKMFDIAKQFKVRSFACVPLFSANTFIGIYTLSDVRPNFPFPSKYFLEDFANHLTQVILRWQAENEMRLKDLSIENSISAIVMADTDGKIKYVNDSLVKMWDFDSRKEIFGYELSSLWEDRNHFKEAMNLLKLHNQWIGELMAATKYGDTFICQAILSLIKKNDNDTPQLMSGSFLNISNEVSAIKEMQETRGKYFNLIDSAFDAIVFVKNGFIEYANPSFFKLVKLENDKNTNTDIRFDAFLPAESAAAIADLERQYNGASEWQVSTEFIIVDMNGAYIEVGASISRSVSMNLYTNTLYIMRNISLRKQTERELIAAKESAEQLSRSKSSFLASMSHEIRTPLNGILGFAQVLADEANDKESKEIAMVIHKSGKRLLDTLNQILDISRIEANKYDLQLAVVSLSEPIEEVVNLFYPLAQQKSIALICKIESRNIEAKIDKKFFIGIINNLLNNAVKFTNSGEISVHLTREYISGNWFATVKVEDTGIGISKENIHHVFEEFRQVSEGIGRNYEGTGLGLSLAKRFTEMMGGTIEVQSESGVGTRFVVRFPIATGEENPE